jgi:hypothetical protein
VVDVDAGQGVAGDARVQERVGDVEHGALNGGHLEWIEIRGQCRALLQFSVIILTLSRMVMFKK